MNSIIISIVSLLSIISGILIYRWYKKTAIRNKLKNRIHRAMAGEKNAREYLEKHNFKILGEQVTTTPQLRVDDSVERFTLRADFLAIRKGRKAIIDAKSGPKAADPRNPETRRRMFEYFHYYDVHDIYIYDDIKKQLKQLVFLKRGNKQIHIKTFFTGLLCGILLFIIMIIIAQKVLIAG